MFVFVNGKMHPLAKMQTLAELLRSLSPSPPFAIARNEEVVPGGSYEECCIESGDRIEIVHPTAGG